MPGLDPRRTRILSAWLERVLCGYWTHAGYLNWDTGLGFARWHQGKKLGLAQAALLGLAASDELRPDARHGAWAKALLDAGFALWDRWLGAAGGLPPANAFQVPSEGDNVYSQRLASARVAANAAKAVLLGLGERPGEAPPPLYAHDPDTGRLAITTPVYNTAVVPSSRRAFPYGGLDVARLFDAAQAPAGNVGGRPPAAFGMVIRDRAGRTLLASQRPLAERPGTKLLTLTRAPRGSEARLHAYPRRPYAGPFDVLDAHGTVHAGGARIRVAHRFLPAHVQTTWTQVADPGGTTAAVHFPSTGPGARIVAVLDDGAERRVRPGDRIALERVRHVHVRGGTSGYVVVPVAAPAGAVLGAVRVARQPSAPRAGPSARIELPRTTRPFLTARYAPARDPDEAARAAARLRAR
jgi:hypothetical protein